MRRITKAAAIGATALTALTALGSAAGATVNVTDGVGHVDKGDVQTALKWNNSDFDNNVASPNACDIGMITPTRSSGSNSSTPASVRAQCAAPSRVRYAPFGSPVLPLV